MSGWSSLKMRLEDAATDSQSWKSDLSRLSKVLDFAAACGIDDRDADKITISNLRTMVSDLSKAVRLQDRNQVEELLSMAVSISSKELRLKLGKPKLSIIFVNNMEVDGKQYKQIVFTKEQIEILKRDTRLHFVFRENTPIA